MIFVRSYLLLFIGLSIIATGCEHYKPMDFPPQNGERPKPGLFSGQSGAFEIPLNNSTNTTSQYDNLSKLE
ncbi:MAG: hypothetical protein ACRYGR_03935 [Janthinobacterium lividum]